MNQNMRTLPWSFLISVLLLFSLIPSLSYLFLNIDTLTWKKIVFYFTADAWLIAFPFVMINWNKAKYLGLLLIIPIFSQLLSLLVRAQFLNVDVLLSVFHTNIQEAGELIMASWKFLFLFIILSIGWIAFLFKPRKVNIPRSFRWAYLSLGIIIYLPFLMWHINKIKKYDHRSSFYNCTKIGAFYARDELSHNLSSFNFVDVLIESIASYRLTLNYEHNIKQFNYDIHVIEGQKEHLNVIFVIGESSRVDHWSLFGYSRDTTPLLKDSCTNMVAFPNAYSGANLTIKSVPILISPATSMNMKAEYSSLPIVAAYKHLGYQTYWFTSQKYSNESIINKYSQQSDTVVYCYSKQAHSDDEMVLSRFRESIRTNALTSGNRFYVLHTMGSHFRYNQRCRKQFFKFTHTIDDKMSVTEMTHHKDLMINSYDNTIVATDYLLYELYKEVQQLSVPTILVYMSDHGEMLGEKDVFLHGLSEPTKQEIRVPLLLQFNDAFKTNHAQLLDRVIQQRNNRFTCNYFMDFLCKLSSFKTQFSLPNTTFCDKEMSSPEKMSVVGTDSKLYLFD